MKCDLCGAEVVRAVYHLTDDLEGMYTCETCDEKLDTEPGNLTILEYIDAIEKNYPPERYTMLREALNYCLELLRRQL